MSSESNTHADTSAEEVVENADSTATFKAVVSLPDEVNVATGEENDETLFKRYEELLRNFMILFSRARLYRFAAETKEWKERGTGDVKFLKNKESNVVRCVMRQEKTNKLCLNHNVNPLVEIKPNAGSETSWVFTIDDFAEGSAKLDTFAIRFKTVECILLTFFACYF